MSSHNKYAVLDFETTGFGSIDRVVEVGIVLLDEYFEVEETWDSLIQTGARDSKYVYSQDHG